MINQLFFTLLLHPTPDMYRNEVAHTDTSVTLSLVPFVPAKSAMTGQFPRALYLLSLPLWRPLLKQVDGAAQVSVAEHPQDQARTMLLQLQYQCFYDRLIAGNRGGQEFEIPKEAGALAFQISTTTLWHKIFTSLPAELMATSRANISCLQIQTLASLFSDGRDVVSDKDENNTFSDHDATSSFFSVLNLTIPTNSAPAPTWRPLAIQRAASQVEDIPDGSFIYPLNHEIVVTSPYGMRYHPVMHQFMRHEGVDFRAPIDSPVMTIADGEVVNTGYGPVTGFYITVNHADGWNSRYLHLNKIKVVKGDKVLRGNVIALSGASGRTNGPHLHLELSHHQKLSNPMDMLFASMKIPNDNHVPSVMDVSTQTVEVKEFVDMTPTIALISGEGKDMQIGVRIGKKTKFYSSREPVETVDGVWHIVKRYGKYVLVKQE